MTTRRKFLTTAGVGAAASLAAPAVRAQSTIRWRMQTCAGAALAEHVVKPAIDSFNKIAGDEMQIELYCADRLVPTGELFRAMRQGTIDAVQSDNDSMASPTEVTVFGSYFPFASRCSLDVRVLFNQYGLNGIGAEDYAKVGVKHIGAGAWDPCHFATKDPIRSLDDLTGKRVFTFPTAGRFLAQFGVVPVTLQREDIEVAVQTGELDGIAWSGITEDYTVGRRRAPAEPLAPARDPLLHRRHHADIAYRFHALPVRPVCCRHGSACRAAGGCQVRAEDGRVFRLFRGRLP